INLLGDQLDVIQLQIGTQKNRFRNDMNARCIEKDFIERRDFHVCRKNKDLGVELFAGFEQVCEEVGMYGRFSNGGRDDQTLVIGDRVDQRLLTFWCEEVEIDKFFESLRLLT